MQKKAVKSKRKTITGRMRAEALTRNLNYWAAQLRLQSWDITVEFLKWEKDNGFGDNSIDPHYETSHICLYDPETIPDDVKGVRDLEVTLVHELLHIRLVYVAKTSMKKKHKWPVEMAIETIAQSLVANRRGINIKDLKKLNNSSNILNR